MKSISTKNIASYLGQFLSFTFPTWKFSASHVTELVKDDEYKVVPNYYNFHITGKNIKITLTIRLEFSDNSKIPSYYLVVGEEEDVLDEYGEIALMSAILRTLDNQPTCTSYILS